MSLMSMVNRVADEVGLPRATAVATGTQALERQYFALSNAALEELGELNWPILEHQYSFTGVVGQAAYPVPGDFKRNVSDTAYTQTAYYNVRGSLTPSEWATRRSSLNTGTGRYRYRLFGQPLKYNMLPVPQTTDVFIIEYVSNNYAVDMNGVPIPIFANDSDTPILPEELVRLGLKWRIKHAKGLDYSEDYNAYQMRTSLLFAQQSNYGSIPVAYRNMANVPELGEPYVPENGFGP